MIRMMIADDEKIERDALCLIIRRLLPEVEIVGVAENGRQAIELAEKLDVDLMTVDIKMPNVDGLEVVRALSQSRPELKYIVISAYNTFEYARQVMKYGVRDFLVKPYKKEMLAESVGRLAQEIVEARDHATKQRELSRKAEAADSLLEAELVSSLIIGRIYDRTLVEWKEQLDFASNAGIALIIHIVGKGGREDLDRQIRQLEWIRTEWKQSFNCLIGTMTGRQLPVFVLLDLGQIGNQQIKTFISPKIRKLLAKFEKRFPQHSLFIGIGDPYPSVDRWSDSYHEAMLTSNKLDHPAKHIYYRDQQGQLSGSKRFPIDRERRMLTCLIQGMGNEALSHYEAYLRRWGNIMNMR